MAGFRGDMSRILTDMRRALAQDRDARRMILGLLALNCALIGLPIALEALESVGWLASRSRPMLHPTTDGSVQEQFNYLQAGATAIVLGLAAVRFRSVMCLAWAAVFAFILCDDALLYHERVGAVLADGLGLPQLGGLRAVDLGELIAWGLAGLVLGPLPALAYLRSTPAERGLGWMFLALFGGLVVFAVGVDMVHSAVPSRILMVAEDGGEMIAIALACGLGLTVLRNGSAIGLVRSDALATQARVRPGRLASSGHWLH